MKKKKATHLGVCPFSGQGYSFISHAFSSYFPMYLIANVSHTQVKIGFTQGLNTTQIATQVREKDCFPILIKEQNNPHLKLSECYWAPFLVSVLMQNPECFVLSFTSRLYNLWMYHFLLAAESMPKENKQYMLHLNTSLNPREVFRSRAAVLPPSCFHCWAHSGCWAENKYREDVCVLLNCCFYPSGL